MDRKKNYNIKIYTTAGAYVRTLPPSVVMTGVSFSAQVDGGQGQATIKLAIPFNTSLIAYNNIIKIYESDDANPTGRQIYTGIVGSLQRTNEGGAEFVEIRAVGLASMLSWIYYDAAGAYSFSKNTDASNIMKDIIDRFAVKYPGFITYDGSSVETSGITANLSFAYTKALDALRNAAQTTQFFWTIDGTGKLQFHPRTGGTWVLHHKVDMGYEVDTIQLEENVEKLTNKYLLDWASGTVTSQDATSQTANGIRELHESKTDIANVGTAQSTADAYIAKNKDPRKKYQVTINNNYDIESIRPGDLMTVRNVDLNISALQISKIEYNPDNIRIQLEDVQSLAAEIFTL